MRSRRAGRSPPKLRRANGPLQRGCHRRPAVVRALHASRASADGPTTIPRNRRLGPSWLPPTGRRSPRAFCANHASCAERRPRFRGIAPARTRPSWLPPTGRRSPCAFCANHASCAGRRPDSAESPAVMTTDDDRAGASRALRASRASCRWRRPRFRGIADPERQGRRWRTGGCRAHSVPAADGADHDSIPGQPVTTT